MTLQLGVTAVATALSVDTTVGLPGSTPFTLLLDAGTSAEEIVNVTQVSGNTLVVQRGQDGTSAQPHANGAPIRHALTARDLRDSREHEAATVAHGVTSALVGTTDPQALTNKNLSSTTNVFPSSLASASALAAELTARADGDTTQATALTNHAALAATHGATGAVVGTTNVQTLTNKTLASAQFTGTATNLAASFVVGDPTTTTQPAFYVRKKATANADAYEAKYYLTDSTGGTTSALGHVLTKNGAEIARTQLNADGRFGCTGGIDAGGTITADNLGDTGWVTTGFGVSSGWSLSPCSYRVRNGVVTLNLRFSRTGTPIVSSSNANVADVAVLTVPTTARTGFNVTGTGIVLATAGSGGFVYQILNGAMTIVAAMNPSFTWNTGADFYTTITYLL